jgi:hypothetical protein
LERLFAGADHELDVVNALLGAHLVQSLNGDASGVTLESVLVGVEYLSAVALGVLAGDRGRISDLIIELILEHDYVLARDGALRGSTPGHGSTPGAR